MKTIALIAHDKKKSEMLEFVGHHKDFLAKFHLIATRTTGTLINDTFGLGVETMLSGPLGGDQQIGARVAVGEVDYVVFLRDPLTSQPHEPDSISSMTSWGSTNVSRSLAGSSSQRNAYSRMVPKSSTPTVSMWPMRMTVRLELPLVPFT